MAGLSSTLTLAAIRAYQRFVSPYKGFSCAYRCHTGCASCSALGYRAIRRFGVLRGAGILRQRLERCTVAHQRYTPMARARLQQAGYCDLSCDLPCDIHDIGCADIAACNDCGSWGKKKRENTSDHMHIPPFKSD
ncbi:MAG: membrane protein insertion efficiency factor YidD [Comamonadaceae bacterium]|nr:MAG: membrane protein insertion efficiency factor YidD [Comamonadaceae bacterium]